MVRHLHEAVAISGRELRAHAASPASWLTLGLFALIVGGLYVDALNAFLDQSNQALATPPPQPINLNHLLARPLFVRIGIAALVVLPLITLRAYPAAVPASSRAIATGKFLGTLGVYVFMLLLTALHVAVLFAFGGPEWASILTGYLGLALFGAAFIAVGLYICSTSTPRVVAAILTVALALIVAAATWFTASAAPGLPPVLAYASLAGRLDDFGKGVIDTRHVIFGVSLVAVALFLTVRALDRRERASR